MKKSVYDKRIPVKILFLLGALLGAVSFLGVYGIKILDCTNTGWLFYGDNDLRQHYIAWCNYRQDPWHFPIGLIDSLSAPYSMSVMYTDSIPAFAVLFKLFRSILPVTFQYFGLFGIMSFMLMGGLSAVLISRFVDNPIICVLGSEFYTLSFTVIHRMYYHTALAAQWIIILALLLWTCDTKINGNIRKSLAWGAMGFLCVAIHPYYLPMVGMILAALMISQFCVEYSREHNVIKSAFVPVAECAAFCVCGLINMWILGAFYGEADGYAGGLGTFNANLNTFVNPLDHGVIMPELPVYNFFQYEGFGYLGFGIILLFVAIVAVLIYSAVRHIQLQKIDSSRLTIGLVCAVFAASCLLATMPLISVNEHKIVWFPYPGVVEKVLGIFRSNGRFIWVAMYILITVAICVTANMFKRYRNVAVVMIMAALVFQLYDGSKEYRNRYDYYTQEYPIATMWDTPQLSELIKDKDEFIFLYLDNDITLYTAYYGYLHNMKQNNYYYARGIDGQIQSTIDDYMFELYDGFVRENAVYIIKQDMYEDNRELYDSLGVTGVCVDGHVIFIK